MADNIKYRFIQNVGDYFPSGYFNEDFIDKVQRSANVSSDEMNEFARPFTALKGKYESYKNYILNQDPRTKDAIKHTHDFNTELLKVLGYDVDGGYSYEAVSEEDHSVVPVRMRMARRDNSTSLLVMEMQHMIKIGETEPAGLFDQRYNVEGVETERVKSQQYWKGQWREVFELPEEYKISPSIINKAIDALFLLPQERRPRYILMMAGNMVFLLDAEKWNRGAYLQFSLDDLFSQASIAQFRKYYALFHLLVSRDSLAGDSETALMQTLVEESYKSAYEVTKDLKEGVVLAVETLANEALHYMRQNGLPFGKYKPELGGKDNPDAYDETDDAFEAEVKDDCLTMVYRLLFVFYAESRPELGILPLNDDVYKRGYSLEMLRDLEMVRLNSEESREGFFFDVGIRGLFRLMAKGFDAKGSTKSFSIRPIDSPLFDDSKLHHLGPVKIRNSEWQKIIQALSLSKSNGRRSGRGRISYANLGVNQLGSVYESLLAFRGFYAEEDYIEVHKANKPEDGTFLVPKSRMDDFEPAEILRTKDETGEEQIAVLPKGSFVYRLNGRDRQKSASYYTPEVLTRSTVKYTLKTIVDEVAEGKRKAVDLLDLKILEPAMGAAAFQNEVINQLAEAYLKFRQQEMRDTGSPNWRVAPDHFRDELQKVKAYIATHNVYGVDLNPTAIELGKLSLWLNVIHSGMEVPFFSNRLALGNAVIGAWLKTYRKEDVQSDKPKSDKAKLVGKQWWTKAPEKVHFFSTKVNRSVNSIYHFLLPDKNMLGVRSIKEQKQANPEAYKIMSERIKNWTRPIADHDFRKLQRLSQMIDRLLKEYFEFQTSIEKLTNNKMNLWGVPGTEQLNLESYSEKQKLNDTRYRHDNAYFRLKMVMDYWCALWFWEYEDAPILPTREEYWADIEAMLNVSDEELNKRTEKALSAPKSNINLLTGQLSLNFDEDINAPLQACDNGGLFTVPYETEETAEIKRLSKEEILVETKGEYRTFFDDSERFKTVKRYADRYHFFHPMLEFLEVFWLRDGFDIICGNPPWIKLQFNEQSVISDKYPEVVIRKVAAPAVRQKIDQFMQNADLERLYRFEESEQACSTAFLNAVGNYPLLVGQQTNLYKCILHNCFDLINPEGYTGILCPDGIYDDPAGQPFRKELYKRLRYHFQYQNELRLFAEVDHHTVYGDQLLGPRRSSSPRFASLSNLFHPNTVDACFAHDGHGLCGGIKDDKGNWNTAPHRDRIVYIGEEELKTLSATFEDGADWESAKLVGIHAREIIDVLKKLSDFPTKVCSFNPIISEGLHESGSVDKGIIKRNTKVPTIENFEMIYSGPHFFVGNPFYKSPRQKCVLNSDYDTINLRNLSEDYVPRTNYTPLISESNFKNLMRGFIAGQENGKPIYSNWFSHYKVGLRRLVGSSSERTLSGAILMKNCLNVDNVITIMFKETEFNVEFSGLSSSIPLDFYLKTLGIMNLHESRVSPFPLGVAAQYQSALYSRTLMLNCLTRHYAELWEEVWRDDFTEQTWSLNDPRLKPFSSLTREWQWSNPLRNYFERRQALVEIDVIAAMALGLSLEDLEMIYTIQFPVLQQNEADTWYDAKGNIVFTCSKGLTGVGVDRPVWDTIRDMQPGQTYVHTIDPKKSELYGGQQITYHAPFTGPDRITDYRRAWAHFEQVFNK